MIQPTRIVIIDYNSGNLRSVFNAISSIKEKNQTVLISSNPQDLKTATHIILPGVGAFKDCAKGLKEVDGMVEEIKAQIKNKKPFLGICVGMQLLADIGYEHGKEEGLALISGEVKKISDDDGKLKIPQIGWNNLEILSNHKILENIEAEDHVYFVNSYMFEVKNKENILAQVSYGKNKINAILVKDNIIATQFHPEKSAKAGLQLLKNFIS